jgi:hypothetical protein
MTHAVTNTKTPKRSYSLFDGWGTCQLRSFFDRTGARSPPTPAMLRGTQAHNALETIGKKIKAGWLPSEAVEYVQSDPPHGPLSPGKLESWVKHAEPMFKGLEITDVERWFDTDTNDWDLRGKIDLEAANTPIVDDMGYPVGDCRPGPIVLDYKTIGQARYCKQEWEISRSLQAAIYSLTTGVRRFGYVYLLPNGEVRITMAEIPEEAIERHKKWLTVACRQLDAAWAHMRRLIEDGEDPQLAFAPAAAGHPFCSPKCSRAADCPVFGGGE